jgi:hypothetical protein
LYRNVLISPILGNKVLVGAFVDVDMVVSWGWAVEIWKVLMWVEEEEVLKSNFILPSYLVNPLANNPGNRAPSLWEYFVVIELVRKQCIV